MVYSGVSPDKMLVEIAELKDHPFMLGTQFHPEFLSRPTRPHPLFLAFIRAAAEKAGVEVLDPPLFYK
jgi:CTP synthase